MWEFFRALGRAKAALAGKRTQPKGEKPGMTAIKRSGATQAETGVAAVISGIHAESQPMHQARGAGVAAALHVASAAQAAGLPLAVHRAEIDTRTGAEVAAVNARAAEEQAAVGEAWTEWRERSSERWAGMHGTMGGIEADPRSEQSAERAAQEMLEALDSEDCQRLTAALRTWFEGVLPTEALQGGLSRFREVQGVGVGGFSGIWVARASAASQRRYLKALRQAAVDVRVAAEELERAQTLRQRRTAVEAVRRAA